MTIVAVMASFVTFLGIAAIIFQLANKNSAGEVSTVVGGVTSLGGDMFK